MTDSLWLKVVKDLLEVCQGLIEKLHQIEVTCEVLREKKNKLPTERKVTIRCISMERLLEQVKPCDFNSHMIHDIL